MMKYLSILLLFLATTACTSLQQPTSGDTESTAQNASVLPSMQQLCAHPETVTTLSNDQLSRLYSLCNLWYRQNPVPEFAVLRGNSELTWQSSYELATGALPEHSQPTSEIEQQFIQNALGLGGLNENLQDAMCYFAVRDADNDGILDFRLSSAGRFYENDTDIDNDGVPNVRDSHPVDPDAGDDATCGQGDFPQHLALKCDSKNTAACKMQEQLYKDYDVVLVNRDYPEDDERIFKNVQTFRDVIHLFYGDNFAYHPAAQEDCPGLPTLKTIAFEQCVVLRDGPWTADGLNEKAQCRSEDEWVTNAEAQAHNASVVFYVPGLEAPDIVRLGVFAHELAHSWTFAYDFDTERKAMPLLTDNFWNCPGYEKELKKLGWKFTSSDSELVNKQLLEYNNVVNVDNEVVPYLDDGYELNGENLLELQAIVGADDAMDIEYSTEARNRGLTGSYGASDPWEWFSDSVQAYLFRLIEDHVFEHSSKATAHKVRQWFRAQVIEAWGNEFYYPHLSEEMYQTMYDEYFAVSTEALDELTCRYVVYSDDFIFKPLQGSPTPRGDKITLKELKKQVREDWRDVCTVYINS